LNERNVKLRKSNPLVKKLRFLRFWFHNAA
jgi:hypothetical protein